MEILFNYLLVINIISFIAFGLDKYLAIKKQWRISEKTLIGLSTIGGSIGSLIGMIIFRHKIRKPKFYITIPVLLIIHIYTILKLLEII